MTRACRDRRVPRLALAALAALLATAPALAQAVTVIGDRGGAECYRAARVEDVSASALDACTYAIESGTLLRRDLAATHMNRGIILAARGELEAALADYREARRISPDLPESYVGEGNVRFFTGDYEAALAAYADALEHGLGPARAAHFNRGLTFEKLGLWDEAEAAYRQAAALSPGWGPPLAHLERLPSLRAAAERARGE
jgi:tetratricopeptide (TPR) repeat protein